MRAFINNVYVIPDAPVNIIMLQRAFNIKKGFLVSMISHSVLVLHIIYAPTDSLALIIIC